MHFRTIGSLRVSVIGLGTGVGAMYDWRMATILICEALDRGITFFDTADSYNSGRSEELLGHALGRRRHDAVIATKVGSGMGPGTGGASGRWVRLALEDSLRRLHTDHIDLYQVHTPDPETSIAETLEVLDEAVAAGKVLEIGCSNFSGAQIGEATLAAAAGNWRPFVSAQNHYNMLNRSIEIDVLPACRRHGLKQVPYFPLASGFLTGKYRRGEPPPPLSRLSGLRGRLSNLLLPQNFDLLERLDGFARERGHSVLELAIAWLLADRTVATVIAGATTPEQIAANAAAASWQMSDEERQRVGELLEA